MYQSHTENLNNFRLQTDTKTRSTKRPNRPEARLKHALELRKVNYGTDRVSSRLQRVLEITQRPSR